MKSKCKCREDLFYFIRDGVKFAEATITHKDSDLENDMDSMLYSGIVYNFDEETAYFHFGATYYYNIRSADGKGYVDRKDSYVLDDFEIVCCPLCGKKIPDFFSDEKILKKAKRNFDWIYSH